MEWNNGFAFPIIESALEMILIFDGKGMVSYANGMAEKKLEYEGGLCGTHIGAVFPNEFHDAEGGVGEGIPFGEDTADLFAYRKNQTCFPVKAKFMKSKEMPDMYICMAKDMLEQDFLNKEIVLVRQEAQEALKVKSEFVANVTHELRTPVNGVLGNVKELLGEELDAGTVKSLRVIERCCGDMNKIINNILDFSKLEAGKFTLEPREFHFRNMLDYVRSHHINKITEKGLGFFMTVSPQIPECIIGDELRIVQILNNLLSNALKFTSVGKISVEAVRTAVVNDKMELFFMVKDTGIGMDGADKEKLFQSFSQADASISRKYGGTGLGLNICKQLVELMGGKIEVESEKNKGSTFLFSIWVGFNGEEGALSASDDKEAFLAADSEQEEDFSAVKKYGTPENRENLKDNLSKLILCVEMENWEKAETFMETVKQLTEGAPREVSRMALRLKMAIQKENYDRILREYEELNKCL